MDIRDLHIPLQLVDGQWVLPSGEAFPEFEEGTFAELRVGASCLKDKRQIAKFLKSDTRVFLPAGIELVAEMARDGIPEELKKKARDVFPLRNTVGVPFVLVEDLEITLTAGKKGRLEDCECEMPSLEIKAKSINETYTRISEKFEPQRRSHTGNVFTKVFVLKPSLCTLEHLRQQQRLETSAPEGGTEV